MQLIATRIYHDFNPATGVEFEVTDRVYRKGAHGPFVLMRAGDLPGDPEVEEPYSLKQVFGWLQDCTWQIRRAVIVNERPPSSGVMV